MYKLCIALAFLAVAAAKPNFPLAYSGLGEYGYPYPAASAYPYDYGYNYGYGYNTPLVAKSYAAPVVAPVAPLVKNVAPFAPVAPVAPVAPIAPIAPISPLAYHGFGAEPVVSYGNAGYPFIVKK